MLFNWTSVDIFLRTSGHTTKSHLKGYSSPKGTDKIFNMITLETLKDQFKSEGAVFPIDILEPKEVQYYRNKLISYMEDHDWKLNAITRHKPHMQLNWVNQLGKDPRIINTIKPILGENILLWYSVLFVKSPNTTAYVPWHQDATYWALNKNEGLTLWLALSDVTPTNGCVEYIPGSHQWNDMDHSINNNSDNLLARGQEISGFSTDSAKNITLGPGQASLHDVSLLHSSKANLSNQPRLGIAFRYIPADNFPKTLKFLKRSATLVSGQLKHQHFIEDPDPSVDSKESCKKAHRRSVRVATIHTLFGDSARSIWTKIRDVVPTVWTKKTLQYFNPKKGKDKSYTKHSILVTGASSGMGREFCVQLAEQARTMIITGRNQEELSLTVKKIKEANPQVDVFSVTADLCDKSDRERLIQTAKQKNIDYLVLNAGHGNFGPFIDQEWTREERVVELNISSTVHLCNKLIPHLIEMGRDQVTNAKLIIVSSHAGYMRVPNFSVYASCKSFLNSFGLTLVQELRDQPVDILVSCPGATQSQFSKRAGLPKKMLSTPLPASTVVKKTLASTGSKSFLIITPLDKLIYFLSRLLPVEFFDFLITKSQKKLLGNIKTKSKMVK